MVLTVGGDSLLDDDTVPALLDSSESGYSGMSGLTAYNRVEGEFYLKSLPMPIKQEVKQTVQGIIDSFSYESENIAVKSIISENDRVKVTELVYTGEVNRVMNKSMTAANVVGSAAVNLIITEHGIGEYSDYGAFTGNQAASTHHEIVAIAVEDVRPFLLKSLENAGEADMRTEQTALQTKQVPTNSNYIRHLTPEKEPRIATITSPAILTAAGGPLKILVYYDAIDLTGQTIAGTDLAPAGVNAYASPFHNQVHNPYLVVRKTVPPASTSYTIAGVPRTLSDILRRPYDTQLTAPTDTDLVKMEITSPGGIISVPSKNFNRPLKSHTMSSSPTGEITPSPFINIEDCMVRVGTGFQGYGRPKPIPSIVVPDATTDSDFHMMTVVSGGGKDIKSYSSTSEPPSSMSRSNLMVFDIIDNEVTQTENQILVQPKNRIRHDSLTDFIVSQDSSNDPSIINIELSLLRGRVDEIEPGTSTNKSSGITIRGRSQLMDLTDQRAKRDFNLSEGTPIKEIGDLGTPTVSLSLGGPGQGAMDIKPSRVEHPYFPGWKDRIIGSGNASVRNDKQASTYYASTRALVEFPLFPSMFFDIDKIISTSTSKRDSLPTDNAFELIVDCTMTPVNRPQMKEHESRFSIDWGVHDAISSIEVTDFVYSLVSLGGAGLSGDYDSDLNPLIRCQRPSVQAVFVSGHRSGITTGTITVDDASAFVSLTESGLNSVTAGFYVTIGEGIIGNGLGICAKITNVVGNVLSFDTAFDPSNKSSPTVNDLISVCFAGMTITLGGYIVGDFGVGAVYPVTWNYDLSLTKAQMVELIAVGVRLLLGKGSSADEDHDVRVDPYNENRIYIRDGPNMEALEYDPEEIVESYADRPLRQAVECRCSALSLKGKDSDGAALTHVQPLVINLGTIGKRAKDFDAAVREVIRVINAAAHPQAKNGNARSNFDPPVIFDQLLSYEAVNTGSHMGYVRAFEGLETESKDGEKGMTIVIHSTVPGATGRNFAVWLNNNSPYPYLPIKAVGSGGLLATNSLHYQANSFPAPLPIGSDGETFVPITTFTGAPHGRLLDHSGSIRSYEGVGQRLTVDTVAAPLAENLLGVSTATTMLNPIPGSFSPTATPPINHLAVDRKVMEHTLRMGRPVSPTSPGLLKIGDKYAYFTDISLWGGIGGFGGGASGEHIGVNCAYIRNITPLTEPQNFYDALIDRSNNYIGGIEIEIIDPLIDCRGILFFGGGHTGVTVDISDGTDNDYSNHYTHHYAGGPTGFSGFQNLDEVSTAAAVLDFTNLRNEDTINETSLVGIHHKTKLTAEGQPIDDCLFYLRLNEADKTASPAFVHEPAITEHLYGSLIRLTAPGVVAHITGPASDPSSKGMLFATALAVGGQAETFIIGQNNNGVSYRSELPHMDSTTSQMRLKADKAFTVSVWIKKTSGPGAGFARGPIIHGIDSDGYPWGLSISGGTGGSSTGINYQRFNVALHYAGKAATGNQGQPMVACISNTLEPNSFMKHNGWLNIVYVSNLDGSVNLYLGCETGFNAKAIAPTFSNAPFWENMSAKVIKGPDKLYDNAAYFANSRGGTTPANSYGHDTVQSTAPGTSEGVADHPYITLNSGPVSTVDATKAVRDRGFVTVGKALHGPPYLGADMTDANGDPSGGTINDYYGDNGSVSGSQYGIVDMAGTAAKNHVGPIYIADAYLSEVAVWDRALSVDEAQAIFDARVVW